MTVIASVRATDHGTAVQLITGCRAVDLIGSEGLTQRRMTPEGFMVSRAKISRVGTQKYYARELGLPGIDGDRLLIAYRPASEVFHPDAMKSFELKTLANDHPPVDITSENWAAMARDGKCVGDVHDIHPEDSEHLGATVVARDADMVKGIEGGKSQLSCGYTFDADMTPGEYNGVKYDFVQRNIRGNHVAVVDMARGGVGCRIGDRDTTVTSTTRRHTMETTLVPVTIAGITFNVAATDAQNATSVRDAYDRHAKLAKDCKDSLEAMEAAHKKVKDERDFHVNAAEELKEKLGKEDDDETASMGAENKRKHVGKDGEPTLMGLLLGKLAGVRGFYKAKLTDAQAKVTAAEAKASDSAIEARVQARAVAVQGAKKLIGDSFVETGKSLETIRTEAVAHVIAKDSALKGQAEAGLCGLALDKAPAEHVGIVFSTLVAAKGTTAATDGASRGTGSDIFSILAHDSAEGRQDADRTERDTARADDGLEGLDAVSILKLRSQNHGKLPGKDAGV